MTQEKVRPFPLLRLLRWGVAAHDDLIALGLDLGVITIQRFVCARISRAQVVKNSQLGLLLAGEGFRHGALGLVWSVMGVVGGVIKKLAIQD